MGDELKVGSGLSDPRAGWPALGSGAALAAAKQRTH